MVTYPVNTASCWAHYLPARTPQQHKYHFGHACVMAGHWVGAAQLAARAAQRAGAGLVSVSCATEQRLAFEVGAGSLMVATHTSDPWPPPLLEDPRVNAVLLGSGWLAHADTRQRVLQVLQQAAQPRHAKRQVVLDAGAVSSFAHHVDALRAALLALPGRVVLTPHAAECATLLGQTPPTAPGAWLVRQAQRLGAVLLLKGALTHIAAPTGPVCVNHASDTPWLATAGSGDVLAGVLVGLMAQGLPAHAAAAGAAWLHTHAARAAGPFAMIAEDLIAHLPHAYRALAKTPAPSPAPPEA